jgi:hypothetical protein
MAMQLQKTISSISRLPALQNNANPFEVDMADRSTQRNTF